MLRRRLATSVLLAWATGLAGAALGPATVARAADSIEVVSAGSPQSNPGLLSLLMFSNSDITSLTAQLVPAQGAAVDVTDLQYVSTPSLNHSKWQVASPLILPALGSYKIYVTAADSGGGIFDGWSGFYLYYSIQPTITMSTSPNPVDYDHQTVTFSGTLTGTYPDGTTGPVAGQQVNIMDATLNIPFVTTTTAADGTYQVQGTPYPQDTYQAVVPSSDTIFAGSSATTTISSTADPVTLTAQVSLTHVNYGQTVTVTGTVSYLPAGQATYQPLANSRVQVYMSTLAYSDGNPQAGTTTAADGTYSVSFKVYGSDADIHVGAGGLPRDSRTDWFFQPAEVTLPAITVALPVQLSLRANVSAFGVVTVHGCQKIVNMRQGPALPLSIEYSAHPTGPWTRLGTLSSSPGCAGTTSRRHFSGTFPARLAAAYYRVRWAGNAQYEPGVSKAVYAWRYLTKITSLRVSATHVARNGRLTVRGQLWQDNSGWHVYASRPVLIILRPKGSKKWYWIAKPYTNSTGYFTATFKDPVSATWSAVYEGNKTHYASGAKLIYVSTTASLPGGIPAVNGPLPPSPLPDRNEPAPWRQFMPILFRFVMNN